ncbi:MAG: hypothetical protein AAGF23_07260 [Acidobacteriota bacterium]
MQLKGNGMKREARVRIFHSFQEANEAEDQRRRARSREEMMREFEALQERHWGESWRSGPIKKVATWEKIDW